MQFDKSAYRPGLELTQDAGEVIFTKDDTSKLITKSATTPTLAELKEASVLLSQIEGMIKQARGPCPREQAWARYRTSGVLVSPPD